MKKTQDKRLVLLETLLRYADLSGSDNPQFYKDDMLKRLGVCEHVFNIMQIQVGDRCCRMVDCLGGRSRYVIDVNKCYASRQQILQAQAEERRHRDGVGITVLTTLIGMLFVILLHHVIV